MRVVLVTGTRNHRALGLTGCIYSMLERTSPSIVLHGNANGTDDIADAWAKENNRDRLYMPAQWDRHGRSAGLIRNGHMVSVAVALSECGWEVTVEAFPGPDSVGTWDCVRKAKYAGLTVNVHRFEEEESWGQQLKCAECKWVGDVGDAVHLDVGRDPGDGVAQCPECSAAILKEKE